jgi:hypothetical protein
MKTAFAIVLTALGVAQLFAGPERVASPRMAAPRQSAISYPQVELRPRVAPESRVASELREGPEPRVEAAPKLDESRRVPEREATAEKRSAEPPSPTEERRELTQVSREGAQQQQQETTAQRPPSFSEARERMPRERHDRAWWDQRYERIVWGGTGYYFLDAGYWYPAFGYDPEVDTYPYDGPIYATADLTPDQEIATVQATLQADGYYNGSVTRVLDAATLTAITEFQTANGLMVTGALDQPTLDALGLF